MIDLEYLNFIHNLAEYEKHYFKSSLTAVNCPPRSKGFSNVRSVPFWLSQSIVSIHPVSFIVAPFTLFSANGNESSFQLGVMKLRVDKHLVLAAFVLFIFPPMSFSHPHVFIYNSIKIVFDEKGLAGFKLKWAFDDMFSNMIINDFDKNKNGLFEPSEIETIKNEAFSNLKEFDYFTHIKVCAKSFKVKFVRDFSTEIKDNILIYRFFVPCHVQAASSFKEVKISIYDISFYSSVFLISDPVSFENTSPYEHHYRISKNTKGAYYYGQVYPEEITLRFRLKNG